MPDRKFHEELSLLLQKTVTVTTNQGKTYTGLLTGIDTDTLSLFLTNARDETGLAVNKVLVNGESVMQVSSFEKPFDIQSLAERLERVFPKMVKTIENAGVILVMDRIRVTEKGVIEGSGPAAERARKVFEEFVRDRSRI